MFWAIFAQWKVHLYTFAFSHRSWPPLSASLAFQWYCCLLHWKKQGKGLLAYCPSMRSSRRQTASRRGDLQTRRSILWCLGYEGPTVSARSVQSVGGIWTRNVLLSHKFHKSHWSDCLNKVGQELGWNLENNPIRLRRLDEQVGWDFSTYKLAAKISKMATDSDLLRFTLWSQTVRQPGPQIFGSHPAWPPSSCVYEEEVGQREQLILFWISFERVELPEKS